MAYLTEIGVASGLPVAGTGSVFTLNTIAALVGETSSTPTASTMMDRLRLIQIGVDSTAGLLTGSVAVKGTISLVSSVGTVAAVTLVNTVNTVNTVSAVNTVAAVTAVQTVNTVSAVNTVAAVTNITNPVSVSQNGVWLARITDGTASVAITSAAPSSTAAALVVAISPNGINANGSTTMASCAPVTLATDQPPIVVGHTMDRVFNGVTSTTPVFSQATTSLAATQIVASTSGKKIRIMNMALHGNGAVNAKLQSSTTVDITPVAPVGSNYGYVLPFSPVGWFETAVGSSLNLSLAPSNVNVGVHICYVLV